MNSEDAEEPITLVDLIDRLVDPVEPAPISMLPQTGGWVVLICAVLAILGIVALRMIKSYRTNAYRRAALAALDMAGNDPSAIADVLRRTALFAYPRTDVASLYGQDWLAFLDSTGGGDAFRTGAGQIVASAPYRDVDHDTGGLKDLAKTWVQHHSSGSQP